MTAPLWQREYTLAIGDAARIRVGPLEVHLERRAHEWRAAWKSEPDPLELTAHVEAPAADLALDGDDPALFRYATLDVAPSFTLQPRLADRPVVIRPSRPFRLVAGSALDVYVSTPLWLVVELPGPRELFDVPTLRPSDTWFGPSTVDGELCYASRTSARLDLAEVPIRPGRAVTRLHVTNRTRDHVSLERLLLPAPELQLFVSPAGDIFTQPVEVDLAEQGASDIRYLPGPPIIAPDSVPIGAPRHHPNRRSIARILSALWS